MDMMDHLNTATGVKVTFLDANHCPGANMIFFEPPNAPSVLHTGDCRLVQSMQLDPLLQTYRKMKPILVLDTTYCNPKYCFPSQSDVIRFVVDAVKSEAFSQDVLFLFGTYTIGKERVFMEAAKTLNKKVYVSSAKLQVMKCLDLSPEEKEMMTTNHDETNIHAVRRHKSCNLLLFFFFGGQWHQTFGAFLTQLQQKCS